MTKSEDFSDEAIAKLQREIDEAVEKSMLSADAILRKRRLLSKLVEKNYYARQRTGTR